uniref:Uncharacterized protein n=1 Tax=Arion vulgaris TaxID=1028688 RepID=A0A0B7AGZ8_9EUPU
MNTTASSMAPFWKFGCSVSQLRHDKNASQISCYIIIVIENINGKIVEKIIYRKIVYKLERNHLMPNMLWGYRWSIEIWHSAEDFAYDTYEEFLASVEAYVNDTDLKDAYNKVPFQLLMCKLLEDNYHPSHTGWIYHAMFERKMVLRCGRWSSVPTSVNDGVH